MSVSWEIVEGDALSTLRKMPACSVQCCVTSPPFYRQRDYQVEGQIGLESTPDEYVSKLVEVFREVKRVLRDDGILWANLGSSFASKDMIPIPWMVGMALQADGWLLRCDVIWEKSNPQPESVTDRPTHAHEYLLLLSKSRSYFYDADSIREPQSPESIARRERGDWREKEGWSEAYNGNPPKGLARQSTRPVDQGANKRSVWEVACTPFPGAHFATFPPKLIEPCILAGSADRACAVCGSPWVRIVERTPMVVRPSPNRTAWQAADDFARTQVGGTMLEPPMSRTLGFEPSCSHGDGSSSSIVLDPFAGSGTTGMVSLRHNRSFIGIELNPTYVEMARERIKDDQPLFNWNTELVK